MSELLEIIDYRNLAMTEPKIKRIVTPPDPDILTIPKYHIEVIERYEELCKIMGVMPWCGPWEWKDKLATIPPYHGGDSIIGFITSGYRDDYVPGGAKNSPHFFALALDIRIGDLEKQIQWGTEAIKLFNRIGLYPFQNIIHCDLCSQKWQMEFKGMPYWVQDKTHKYRSFYNFKECVAYSKGLMEGE